VPRDSAVNPAAHAEAARREEQACGNCVCVCVQEKKSSTSQAGLRLLERSVFCDRMVFVRATHAMKHMDNVELEVYDSWFNPLLEMRPQLVPDGFVYLRTNADTCARRIEMRSRKEEAGVPIDYLEQIHALHNTWLVEGAHAISSPPSAASVPAGSLLLGTPDTHTRSTLFPASAPPRSVCARTARHSARPNAAPSQQYVCLDGGSCAWAPAGRDTARRSQLCAVCGLVTLLFVQARTVTSPAPPSILRTSPIRRAALPGTRLPRSHARNACTAACGAVCCTAGLPVRGGVARCMHALQPVLPAVAALQCRDRGVVRHAACMRCSGARHGSLHALTWVLTWARCVQRRGHPARAERAGGQCGAAGPRAAGAGGSSGRGGTAAPAAGAARGLRGRRGHR
jgi:Deoxynucleoside kinase